MQTRATQRQAKPAVKVATPFGTPSVMSPNRRMVHEDTSRACKHLRVQGFVRAMGRDEIRAKFG